MQLPPLCSYQEMSYTINIDNENDSTIFCQTFNHTGSGTVYHDINQNETDGLEFNKNYILRVAANVSFTDSAPIEISHKFSKL